MQKHMTHSCCKDLLDRIAGADLLNEIAQHVDRTVPCCCESDCFFLCCEISPCLMLIWMLPNAGAWRMLGKCSTRILPLQGRGCCWLDNSNSSWLRCHETFQTVRRKGSKNSSNRNRMQIFFTLSLVSEICSSTTALTQFPRGQVCWWVDDDWTKAAYQHSPNLLHAATFTISDDDLVCYWWRPTAVCYGLSFLSVCGAFVCVHWVWSFFLSAANGCLQEANHLIGIWCLVNQMQPHGCGSKCNSSYSFTAILKLKSLVTDYSLVWFSKGIWHEERHLTLHRYQGMDCGFWGSKHF